MAKKILICFISMLCISQFVTAQEKVDTVMIPSNKPGVDSAKAVAPKVSILSSRDATGKKVFVPRIATIRSAIIPGWGQAYNKKYWKIPIVYGALGVSGGIFLYNLKTYKELRMAVIYKLDNNPANDTLINPQFRLLSVEALTLYRNIFRQNIDYSALAFILLWGLNVVDATVDAHLKGFNVSSDLTLKISPRLAPGNNIRGLGLAFSLEKRPYQFKLPH